MAVQIGSTTTPGINTSGIVEVLRNSNNRNVISNGSNDIVYAKLTFSSGVYTVSYYYTDTTDETENAYSFPSIPLLIYTSNTFFHSEQSQLIH